MFGIIVLIIVIFFFIIASYEDIKKREVYDYLNYAFTFLILAVAIFQSIFQATIEPISYVGFGLLIGFFFGSMLYYFGIWGGGDAKFLIGFGASSYFLKDYAGYFNLYNINNSFLNINNYNDMSILLSNLLDYIFTPFIKIILIINIIFISILLLKLIANGNKEERKDKFDLFSILFLLLIGLYLDNVFVLFLIGFLSFILIFFGKEELFNSVYFKIKKKLSNLENADIIHSDIRINNKTIVKFEDAKFGLTNEQIHLIQDSINQKDKKTNKNLDKLVNIRKVLPYSILVSLNYVAYIFKIVNFNEINLSIFSFLFKFLFLSFIAGGVLVVGIVVVYYLKNFKKVKISFNKYEYVGLILLLLTTTMMYFLPRIDNKLFVFLFILIFLSYIFIKIAKKIEGMLFVSKKDIDKIVPGDWIVEDIKLGKKKIYSVADFKLGINEVQIENIKKHSKTHSNLKQILVKDGIAFLPPLLIGFILTLIINFAL